MVKEIPLTQGKVALVDDEDYERVNKYKWQAQYMPSDGWRAWRDFKKNGKWCKKQMSCFILDPQPGEIVDHINHDTLDNRRTNLRICTPSQSNANRRPQTGRTSKFKGVGWHKKSNAWRAYIGVNSKHIHLGCYPDEYEAAAVYNWAAKKYFGEFACLNDVPMTIMEDVQIGKPNKTSKFTGVSFDSTCNRWTAQMQDKGSRVLYKRFDTETEAAIAYNKAVTKHRGGKVPTNDITSKCE